MWLSRKENRRLPSGKVMKDRRRIDHPPRLIDAGQDGNTKRMRTKRDCQADCFAELAGYLCGFGRRVSPTNKVAEVIELRHSPPLISLFLNLVCGPPQRPGAHRQTRAGTTGASFT